MTAQRTLPDTLDNRWTSVLAQATPWNPPAVETLVIVPHPDDEVLSTGGLIFRQRDQDVTVRVVAVTDGEAAYPGINDLASIRTGEQRRALSVLGVADRDTQRLQMPDGAVAEYEDDLVAAIQTELTGIGLLVAPWTGDHHTDHEACGRAAQRAARLSGTPLIFGLFWTWHHARPDSVAAADPVKIVLTRPEQRVRRQALDEHASQITASVVAQPMLSPGDLQPMTWAAEYYIPVKTPC